jgi:hypothetical protein
MLRVVNARHLLGKVAPGVALEEDDDSFVVRADGESARLNRRELTKLIFGPERLCPIGRGVVPIPFYQWSLDRV